MRRADEKKEKRDEEKLKAPGWMRLCLCAVMADTHVSIRQMFSQRFSGGINKIQKSSNFSCSKLNISTQHCLSFFFNFTSWPSIRNDLFAKLPLGGPLPAH